MFQRFLSFIAGVDRKTLAGCPATDKMWATHLGLSLLLSFTVVFGVTLHATGYMIGAIWMRLAIALVVAMTVLMFDRALCQSDWFSQGTLRSPGADKQTIAEARQSVWRFTRVAMRLALSLGLAWVIAMFLELAIFSGTINERSNRIASPPISRSSTDREVRIRAEVGIGPPTQGHRRTGSRAAQRLRQQPRLRIGACGALGGHRSADEVAGAARSRSARRDQADRGIDPALRRRHERRRTRAETAADQQRQAGRRPALRIRQAAEGGVRSPAQHARGGNRPARPQARRTARSPGADRRRHL